jgi:hypothetical protein
MLTMSEMNRGIVNLDPFQRACNPVYHRLPHIGFIVSVQGEYHNVFTREIYRAISMLSLWDNISGVV